VTPVNLHHINHRDMLGLCLNEFGLTGSMAEIGVARGDFALTVLSQWQGKRYHMIDPWAPQDPEVYRETQRSEEEQAYFHARCMIISVDDPRVHLFRALSEDAAPRFQDGELDCVYIDGNHSYRAVMADCDAWWPKVRIGGIMGGHDFQTKTDDGWFCEVDKAVLRWASEHGRVFYVTPDGSWFIHKNRP
jgi:hypothetical protein